jgi:hypothetical protein
MIIKEINLSSPKWFKSWEEKSIQLESSLIEGQLSILYRQNNHSTFKYAQMNRFF